MTIYDNGTQVGTTDGQCLDRSLEPSHRPARRWQHHSYTVTATDAAGN